MHYLNWQNLKPADTINLLAKSSVALQALMPSWPGLDCSAGTIALLGQGQVALQVQEPSMAPKLTLRHKQSGQGAKNKHLKKLRN